MFPFARSRVCSTQKFVSLVLWSWTQMKHLTRPWKNIGLHDLSYTSILARWSIDSYNINAKMKNEKRLYMDSFLVVHDMTHLCCCRCRLLGSGWSAEQRGTRTTSAATRASSACRKSYRSGAVARTMLAPRSRHTPRGQPMWSAMQERISSLKV